jgi:hypothetical protein
MVEVGRQCPPLTVPGTRESAGKLCLWPRGATSVCPSCTIQVCNGRSQAQLCVQFRLLEEARQWACNCTAYDGTAGMMQPAHHWRAEGSARAASQDSWMIQECPGGRAGLLLGVFDGHGPQGRKVSSSAVSRLPKIISNLGAFQVRR